MLHLLKLYQRTHHHDPLLVITSYSIHYTKLYDHPSKAKSIHPANTDNDTDEEAVSSDETDTSDSALYPETTDTYTTDENGDETPDAPADANVRKDIQHKLDKALEFCRNAQKLWEEKEPDGALSALDKAYALILTADSDTCPKLMQQKEDIRFMISKRIRNNFV